MNNGFRLGRVLGFEVSLDASWFIILFLVIWSFSAGVFPAQVPGLSRSLYLLMGVSGALLFFLSLLAHELSHAVVARAKGIPVDGITLFLFGGVARTRSEASSPGDEFQIAIVGPLMSFALGALLAGVAVFGGRAGWPPGLVSVAQYIAILNVVLAVFNMLPGFPLDGGRVLRSIVWKFTGDMTRATRIASLGGRGLGWLLIGFGVWEAWRGLIMGGIWLAFIGWFLRNAALNAWRQHVAHDVLGHGTARQILTSAAETVPPDITLEELSDRHFVRRRSVAFPVAENDHPIGLITLGQLRDVPRADWPFRTARETMAPLEDAIVVGPEDSISRVAEKLRASPVHGVLVVRNGRLEGVITATDVASWLGRLRLSRGT